MSTPECTTVLPPQQIRKASSQSQQLTQAVIHYKIEPSDVELKEIMRLSLNLVHKVLQRYNVYKHLSLDIAEQIKENCTSLILLKCIKSFNSNKETEFSTHYTWWLSSHVRCEHNNYMRRREINSGVPLETPLHNSRAGTSVYYTLQDIIPAESVYNVIRYKRIRNNFLEGDRTIDLSPSTHKRTNKMKIKRYKPTLEDIKEDELWEKEKTERLQKITTHQVTNDRQKIATYQDNLKLIKKLAPTVYFTPKSRSIDGMIKEQNQFIATLR